MYDPLGAIVAQTGPFRYRQHLIGLVQIFQIEYRHRLTDLRVGIERGIDIQVLRFGMGLDEQRTTALSLQILHHLPRLILVLLGIGADQRDRLVAEMPGRPHRTELGMNEVGAATGMRNLADIHQRRQLAVLGVHHRDLVGLVGGDQEIALAGIPAAIVQEPGRADLRDLQVVDVAVVHQQNLAGFLDVDHELRLVMSGYNRGDARLGVIVLGVHGHAAGGDDLERLQGIAIHQHVLWRPVGTGDGILVLEALGLGGIHRAGFEADLDLGDVVRFLHPQIDQVDPGIAADDEQITSGRRQPRDVHRVAGLDDVDDLLGVAIDQRHLAAVAQRGGEDVVDVVIVHLLGGALLRRHQHLPGGFHFLHAEFRRRGRFLLDVARHQIDLLGGHLARGLPVGHPRRRAVGDEHLEVFGTLVEGDIRGQWLAGGALAQHTMAAGTALEINLASLAELGGGHRRRLGIDILVHRLTGQGRTAGLVLDLGLGDALLGLRRVFRQGDADSERQRGQGDGGLF